MAFQKKDFIILAGQTLTWATQNNCTKIEGDSHEYFTVTEWCDYFEHSKHTFRRVKHEMVEIGIMIAQRVKYGHYISDTPSDVVTNFELNLKNITTRLETHLAMFDSAKKSKYSKELIARLKEVVDYMNFQLDDEGMIALPENKDLFLEESVR